MQSAPPAGSAIPPQLRALQDLFDLALRSDVPMDAALREAIDHLADRASTLAPDAAEWREVVAGSVEALVTLLAGMDDEIRALQARLVDLEEQRQAGGPAAHRREADTVRGNARGALAGVIKKWVDRSHRQKDHVQQECVAATRDALVLAVQTDGRRLAVGVDEGSWARIDDYVRRCCDRWTETTASGVEAELAKALAATLQSIAALTASGSQPRPAADSGPRNDAALGPLDPPASVELSALGSLLMRDVRSNIMAVGLFATVLGSVRLFGGGSVRPYLYLLALPPLLAFGWFGARRQQRRERERAEETQRRAAGTLLQTRLDRALTRHRAALDRWLNGRGDQWQRAVDAWWASHLDLALQQQDRERAEETRALRLEQAQVQERLNPLRTLRSQLAQRQLTDLRRLEKRLGRPTAG